MTALAARRVFYVTHARDLLARHAALSPSDRRSWAQAPAPVRIPPDLFLELLGEPLNDGAPA